MHWRDTTRTHVQATRTPSGIASMVIGLLIWWLAYLPASFLCMLFVVAHSAVSLSWAWLRTVADEARRDWRRL